VTRSYQLGREALFLSRAVLDEPRRVGAVLVDTGFRE
jgi:hypothetical protein